MRKLIVALIALGAVLLFSQSALAQGEPFMHGQMHGKMGEQMHEQMMSKLNLTEEQQKKVEDLMFQHQMKMIDLKADLEKKQLEMRQLKSSGNYSRDDVIAKVKEINNSELAVKLEMANHHMDVYELLTPEQKKIWDEAPHRMGMMQNNMMMKKKGMMESKKFMMDK